MAKKKLPLSIFEIVWYSICALVIVWGLIYVILSIVDKYNDLSSLHAFATSFKSTFGLALYFWGLIIIAIGAVAGVVVMILFAKTFDKAADREQRRSARLSALKKEEKVVSEQKAEVVEEKVEAPAE
jgi:cation transport ATPase